MDHHPKFEGFRFIGDKRTQLVYDLTTWDDDDVVNDIAETASARPSVPTRSPRHATAGYTLATPGKKRIHRKPRALNQTNGLIAMPGMDSTFVSNGLELACHLGRPPGDVQSGPGCHPLSRLSDRTTRRRTIRWAPSRS